MSEESSATYKEGDLVWVKLGPSWWPGEVKDMDKLAEELVEFKKKPLVVVKFFNEDTYEYVRRWCDIYPYKCEKKNDFIKKGMSAFRAKAPHMEKFPKDVSNAEVLSGGNPNILSDPMFLPERKINYVAEVFGTPSPKGKAKDKKIRPSVNTHRTAQDDLSHITHRRFLGFDDYKAFICIQHPTKDRVPGDPEDEEIINLNQEPEEEYNCHSCSFKTKRLEVMILHTKSHIQGVYMSSKKRPAVVRPKKDKPKKSKPRLQVERGSSDDDDVVAIPKEKKRRVPKRKPKPSMEASDSQDGPTTSTDIRSNLLAEWDISEDDLDDMLEASQNSIATDVSMNIENGVEENVSNETMNFNNASNVEEEPEKATEEIKEKEMEESAIEETSNKENVSVEVNSEKEPGTSNKIEEAKKVEIQQAIKSCFDFDEDEEETIIPTATTGRKIPRVIPIAERKKSKELDEDEPQPIDKDEILKTSESFNQRTNKDKDEIEDAFKELMEITAVPQLPDVQNSLKCEQNFHCTRTVKFPDKQEFVGNTPPNIDESATKLTNPKKRFVKSFEDFENEAKKKEEQEELAKKSAELDFDDSIPEITKLKSKIMSKIMEEAKLSEDKKEAVMSKIHRVHKQSPLSSPNGSPKKSSEEFSPDVEQKKKISEERSQFNYKGSFRRTFQSAPKISSSEDSTSKQTRILPPIKIKLRDDIRNSLLAASPKHKPRSKIIESYLSKEEEKQPEEKTPDEPKPEDTKPQAELEEKDRRPIVPPKKNKWSRRLSHPKKNRHLFEFQNTTPESSSTKIPEEVEKISEETVRDDEVSSNILPGASKDDNNPTLENDHNIPIASSSSVSDDVQQQDNASAHEPILTEEIHSSETKPETEDRSSTELDSKDESMNENILEGSSMSSFSLPSKEELSPIEKATEFLPDDAICSPPRRNKKRKSKTSMEYDEQTDFFQFGKRKKGYDENVETAIEEKEELTKRIVADEEPTKEPITKDSEEVKDKCEVIETEDAKTEQESEEIQVETETVEGVLNDKEVSSSISVDLEDQKIMKNTEDTEETPQISVETDEIETKHVLAPDLMGIEEATTSDDNKAIEEDKLARMPFPEELLEKFGESNENNETPADKTVGVIENLDKTAEKLVDVQKTIEDAEKIVENAGKTVEDVEKAIKDIEKVVEDAGQTVEGIEEIDERIEKQIEDTTKLVEDTTKTVEDITKTVEVITKTVEHTTKPVEVITKTVEDTTKPVEVITKTVEDTTKPFEVFTKTVEDTTAQKVEGVEELLEDAMQTVEEIETTDENVEKPIKNTAQTPEGTAHARKTFESIDKTDEYIEKTISDTEKTVEGVVETTEDGQKLIEDIENTNEGTTKIVEDREKLVEDAVKTVEDTVKMAEDEAKTVEIAKTDTEKTIDGTEKTDEEHHNEVEIELADNSTDGFKFSIQTNLSNFSSREEISAIALATLAEMKSNVESPSPEIVPTKSETSKIPPYSEPEMVPIEGNLTVVSEKDLGDGQVEITPDQVISSKKQMILTNFSADFSDSTNDSTSTNETVSDVKSFDPRGTEFTSKAMSKEFKRVIDNKQGKTYERCELIDILEGTDLDKRNKKLALPKKSIVDDFCDFEDHIPPQIVCAKKLKQDKEKEEMLKDEALKRQSEKRTRGVRERHNKSSIMTTTSKLLERLSESKALPKLEVNKVNKEIYMPKLRTPRAKSINKPIILSDKLMKPTAESPASTNKMKQMNDIEDVEAFVIHKEVKKNKDDSSAQKTENKPGVDVKKAGKAKILQQTIISPSGEIIQPAGASKSTAQSDDNIFDINSMPIVLSDEILTPESIENMPIVISTEPTASVPMMVPPGKKSIKGKIVTKITTAPSTLLNQAIVVTKPPGLVPKQTKMSPRILQTVGNKLKQSIAGATKPGKYIIVPHSAAMPITPKAITKKGPALKKTTAIAPGIVTTAPGEVTGNKIMILTNQQGQQQRLLLTPAQQKILGYPPGAKIAKTIIKGNIMPKTVVQGIGTESSLSGIAVKPPGLIAQKLVVSTSGIPLTNVSEQMLIATTTPIMRSTKLAVNKKPVTVTQKTLLSPAKTQKTILFKNTIKKIPNTEDDLEKQVAEQLEAIRASSALQFGSHSKVPEVKSPPKPPARRSYKKTETKTKLVLETSKPETFSTIKKPELNTVPVEQKLGIETPEHKPDRPLNQLVIQDAVGNQTTITEGQILALPSETVDGQPQSYMLVTLDESGNLTPLNNEALMSLDPNLTGDLSNMVLQIEPNAVQQSLAQPATVKTNKVTEPVRIQNNETLERPPVPSLKAIEMPVSKPVPVPEPVRSINGEPGQQLIISGDPVATQKFLESLSEGTTDLANILANAEGNSILIQADGQQILINTNSENLLSVNNGNEGGGNPVFATQPSKSQDILAAALADTDVFQPDQPISQSKLTSQLSPSNALYPINVGNVLETSLTLSSPIMTPLEVPSTNSKKIPDEEADILTQVPKNVDLPITITDPNISQTVANQQVASLMSADLPELNIPIGDSSISTSKEISSPYNHYSLPSLDESVDMSQKSFSSSMPLLNEDVIEESVQMNNKPLLEEPSVEIECGTTESLDTAEPFPDDDEDEEDEDDDSEGRFTLGGEMCSSLSEPPPEMFDLPEVNQSFMGKNNIPSSLQSTPDPSSKDDDTTDLSTLAESSNDSCEIPIQPQIVAKSQNLEAFGSD